jgi:hypothetical protein
MHNLSVKEGTRNRTRNEMRNEKTGTKKPEYVKPGTETQRYMIHWLT